MFAFMRQIWRLKTRVEKLELPNQQVDSLRLARRKVRFIELILISRKPSSGVQLISADNESCERLSAATFAVGEFILLLICRIIFHTSRSIVLYTPIFLGFREFDLAEASKLPRESSWATKFLGFCMCLAQSPIVDCCANLAQRMQSSSRNEVHCFDDSKVLHQ